MHLAELLKASGVIGGGGAGFPTYAKLTQKAEYVLLNAAECEPLIRVDQQLIERFPSEVLAGLEAVRECVGAKKAIVGIKEKHAGAIGLLKETIGALGLDNAIQVKTIADVYPAGDEQVLVYELVGRVVPEAKIPLSVGCVVINVETARNVHGAINGLPVTEKFLTLAGDINSPITVKVPVGTPVMELLNLTGIEDFSQHAVIDGGPMMGTVLPALNGCISKKTKALILLKNESLLTRKKRVTYAQAKRVNRSACEQCRMCTDLCPRYLLGHDCQPHKTMRMVGYNIEDLEEQKKSQMCCLCNLCELFSCPAGLYPQTANRSFREETLGQGMRYTPDKTDFEARAIRAHRLLPSKRLVYRLGLARYDKPAPLTEVAVNPKYVRVFTNQHVGVPAQPVVGVGETVCKGQLIGSIPGKALGAAIHASIDGRVSQVTRDYIEITRGDACAPDNRDA